jgi:histidine triad (HIT) family protein
MESNCIFCKIIEGNIPARKIYEDEDFIVILDAFPGTKGHALIITKSHYASVFELPDFLAEKVMVLGKKMAQHLTNKLSCDGINLIQNNGEVAGQTVFHYHLHLIPRYQNDNNEGVLRWNQIEFSDKEIERIASDLRVV